MKNAIKLMVLGITALGAGQYTLAAENMPSISFSGRIQADATYYDGGKFPYQDGSEARRLRAGFAGDLAENWEYKLEYDFAPDDPEVKDIYFRYTGFENTRITIGNFKVFSSLDELTSSNNMTFTERGLPNALVSTRRTAIGYQTWSDRFSFAAAAYSHEANNLDRGTGASARFAYRPDMGEGRLLHLGINFAIEQPDADELRLRTRPEAHQDSHRLIDTGTLINVDETTKLGLEAAYVGERFSAQGEFIRKSLDRDGAADLSFDGYYAQLSYFLTDDTRAYSNSDAIFGTIVPSNESGAWEIAARFSNLNLNDGLIPGGEAEAFTFAINYYMTRDLRFQANYIMTDSDRSAGGDDPNALQLRVRFTW
ncbi:MAG: porin [Pseudohongiellaceae bacterium]